jgi:protein-tyrosine-phosphatase
LPPVSGDLRVLCVCTHNRTRSVMMAALLSEHLAAEGVLATVGSAGLAGADEPPTDPTVRMLAVRGIDVRAHRSRRVATALAGDVDLIVTAEPDHVIGVAGAAPDAFGRTFTLPELVELGERVGGRAGRPLAEWLAELGSERPDQLAFLDAADDGAVGAIADPTGRAPRAWDTALATIDDLTRRLARLLR